MKKSIILGLSAGILLTPISGVLNTEYATVLAHSHDFADEDVKDRTLDDWTGEWQSAYPHVVSGDLDEAFAHKAEHDDSKTAEEYKEYYEKGYETDVDEMVIDGENNSVTFITDEEEVTGIYDYEGYEILTYDSGSRGVRYLFTATEESDEGAPQYIQFSDHLYEPTENIEHFHLYWGDTSHEEILEELENWPTYYPAEWSAQEIGDAIAGH